MTMTETPPTGTENLPVVAEEEEADESRRNKWIAAGAAVGIGSAALVAALLYARSKGKADKDAGEME